MSSCMRDGRTPLNTSKITMNYSVFIFITTGPKFIKVSLFLFTATELLDWVGKCVAETLHSAFHITNVLTLAVEKMKSEARQAHENYITD